MCTPCSDSTYPATHSIPAKLTWEMFKPLTFPGYLKAQSQSQEDGSANKDACCQGCLHDFHPWIPHFGRRGSTLTSWPLYLHKHAMAPEYVCPLCVCVSVLVQGWWIILKGKERENVCVRESENRLIHKIFENAKRSEAAFHPTSADTCTAKFSSCCPNL